MLQTHYNNLPDNILQIGRKDTELCVLQSSELIPSTIAGVKYSSLKQLRQDSISIAVQDWRAYLAKNLDRDPERLISQLAVTQIIRAIQQNDQVRNDAGEIEKILVKHSIEDDSKKAARLLVAYLDPTHGELNRMKGVICHRCNTEGHTVSLYLGIYDICLLLKHL